MQVNIKNAVSRFYPNPSFEQVYFEAVANAIDAGATHVSILVNIEAFDRVDTLSVTIADDGEGFNDRNFEKFCSLLEVDNPERKGLGRLVFLAYFGEVSVTSQFGGRKRCFVFDDGFAGDNTLTEAEGEQSGTTLIFQDFCGVRVKTYDYLKPAHIKEDLIEHFLPVLFWKKRAETDFRIDIELQTRTPNAEYGFFADAQTLTLSDIPEFKQTSFSDPTLHLFDRFEIFYSIANNQTSPKSVVTAISIDGRVVRYDLVSLDSIPEWYQLRFLFMSDYFRGKTDPSRQNLALPDSITEKTLKRVLRREIGRIICDEIPRVKETNEDTRARLDGHYPYLLGYFPEETVGLIVQNEAITEAQERFLADQKATLECTELDDAAYAKALEVSARVLLEYILYRTKIIAKLKSMNVESSEGEIHDLIVPRRRTLRREGFADDIFSNNVWMLDDKYMSYSTILSDEEMTKVVNEIALDDEPTDGRADITLVFSADPDVAAKVDVVVVELKKHGLPVAKCEEVVSQLRQRARRLLKFFPDKIERIWFYGISDIDDEFKRSLKEDDFIELFSHGDMFYKPQRILVDTESQPFFVDMYVMTYKTFIRDAEDRNSTFLRILKESIRKSAGGMPAEENGAPENLR